MLRERREAAGLTRQELSEMSGIKLRTIEEWERSGVENGTLKNVIKVADVLELFVDQLLTDKYDEVLMIEIEDNNEETTA